jgi:hypothetical protein
LLRCNSAGAPGTFRSGIPPTYAGVLLRLQVRDLIVCFMLCFASAASASGYSGGGRGPSRGTAKCSHRASISMASRPAAHESGHRPAGRVERVVRDCGTGRAPRPAGRSRRQSTGCNAAPMAHPSLCHAGRACNARGTCLCASQLVYSNNIASYFIRTDGVCVGWPYWAFGTPVSSA